MTPADARVDPLLDAWCVEHLGSRVVGQFFGLQRLSAVHGVTLADGREVVLKVRGAQARLVACTVVHETLWAEGISCPQPLTGPHPLVAGPAEVRVGTGEGDEWVDARSLAVSAEAWAGEGVAALGPLSAHGYGRLLARMVVAAPSVSDLPTLLPDVPWLNWRHDAPGRTWPPPASARWDPHRIEAELDPLIPHVARRARERLSRADVATLPVVAGHGDFEAQNCRWVAGPDGAPQLVVHDWDSVVAQPEAVLAGNSASTFVSVEDCELSSLAQNDAFLGGYAAERGRPWSQLEWQVAHATGAWVSAYNAAFEHLKGGPGPVTRGLHEQAEERLGRAGA
jgi:hypothetical protein